MEAKPSPKLFPKFGEGAFEHPVKQSLIGTKDVTTGFVASYTPTLGENSVYTMTEVSSPTSTSITVPTYDESTGTVVNKYYEMTLKKTTYGSGSNSKSITVKIPTNKSVTVMCYLIL